MVYRGTYLRFGLWKTLGTTIKTRVCVGPFAVSILKEYYADLNNFLAPPLDLQDKTFNAFGDCSHLTRNRVKGSAYESLVSRYKVYKCHGKSEYIGVVLEENVGKRVCSVRTMSVAVRKNYFSIAQYDRRRTAMQKLQYMTTSPTALATPVMATASRATLWGRCPDTHGSNGSGRSCETNWSPIPKVAAVEGSECTA
jgi:hypothetical protein